VVWTFVIRCVIPSSQLRQMHLVANPTRPTPGSVASLHLVGTFDAMGSFRHPFWVEDTYLSIASLIVLLPESAQDLDLRTSFLRPCGV